MLTYLVGDLLREWDKVPESGSTADDMIDRLSKHIEKIRRAYERETEANTSGKLSDTAV